MTSNTTPSMDRPWLKNYPPGVPGTVDTHAVPNLVTLLDSAFQRFADRDAAVYMAQPYRYSELDTQSRALAAWLQSRQLERGARVALMLPNTPQYMIAIAAVLRAGLVVVNVNPLYTPRELAHQLKDSGAQAIILLENFANTLEKVIDETPVRHVVLTGLGDLLPFPKGLIVNTVVLHVRKLVPAYKLPVDAQHTVTRFKAALSEGAASPFRAASVGPDDVAFLQYTGGTTGVSKGAILLHRNVVANVLQSEAWFAPMMAKLGNQAATVVCALPLYHIFALTICYFFGAHMGSRNLLIPNPRDFPGFVATLRKYKVNLFPAVNTLYNALAKEPGIDEVDFSGLVVSNSGGMAVQQATAEKWFKLTGCPIAEGYGLSETSPVATANRMDITTFTGTIGFPIPSTDIAILDDEGREVPLGHAGEICIRGPQVMAGYWNRPDETAKVMTADGFFKSGDVGIMGEDGSVRIVDRKKDMVLVSGFNVYPNEIEQVVNMHPGVLECAVVGVPDEHSGEAVKLFVVRSDATLTEEALARHCRENLTGYKRPKHIEFRDDLPKSNVGKILRRELRQ
jgi:long-chain acyl-CoA synthetase